MRCRALWTVVAALLLAPAAAGAPIEHRLSSDGSHVAAAVLAADRDGTAVAAVWSEYRRGHARLLMARIGADGLPATRRVLLRSKLPVRTLGAAASTGREVAVIAARPARSGDDRLIGLLVSPSGAVARASLGRGTLEGRPPAVAIEHGSAAGAWRDARGVHTVRAVSGHWGRVRTLGSAGARPAVAVAPDGSAALVVRRGGGVELRRAAPAHAFGKPAARWPARTGQACCAAVLGDDGTALAAWSQAGVTRVVRAPLAGTPAEVAQLQATPAPPVLAGRPDGTWLVAAWDAAGRAVAAIADPGQAPAQQELRIYRFAPVLGAAVAPHGAVAVLGSFYSKGEVSRRAGTGRPLGTATHFTGAPAGIGFAGRDPVVLSVRWSWHEDQVAIVRPG